LPMAQLRERCGMRTSTLCSLLRRLRKQNRVRRTEHGRYFLPPNPPLSLSLPL
jgi:DNA-binding IclR family transcriptional regulator